ncbi:hypothetical protein NS228_13375 [Methylobacterium indicum]|uniref:Holin n=1 Tax=Methylobacterium indicum TaxID=1775910 RepID=A0A8H9CA58_9HYPH|nr:hypothetical protein [Methylobacterium indicum]KTS39309.1 hypothetical protein NS229_00885 [Methylobacterium indicum]KTS39957.1 hypothetical protein NS228_13375 [Methylobacterium indicum]KTS51359.1 hypothetical protein NS230_13885 [Methylobacterium indicum]BCM87095.1 hypothetical protein mvi_55560 [Methylobacterium indicum]
MNQEQLTTLLRTLLQFAGGIAVGCGWLDADTATTLTGALVTLIVTVWGLYVRRNAGLVAAAAALPAVKAILAAPATAQAVPSPKVRPSE